LQENDAHAWCDDGSADARDAGDAEAFPTVQLDLPVPTNVRVRTAEFVKSSVEISQCPKEGPPEFAVIGRSNVGKSSLINMLTGRKALAQVSKEPGGWRRRLRSAAAGPGRRKRPVAAALA
jgi:GTP-binding protein